MKMSSEWLKIKEEVEQINRELREARGFKELYRLTEGEHLLTVNLKEAPRKVQTIYGERLVIPVIFAGNDMALMVSPISPLTRDLMRIITEALNNNQDSVKIKIIRVGRGRATRYTVSRV